MITLHHYIYYKSDFAKIFDYKIYDFISSVSQQEKKNNTSSNVIVVDIDEKSLGTLGQWPWPRIMLAQLMHKVHSYHPSAIGFDIIFPEKDRVSPNQIVSFYQDFFNVQTSMEGLPQSMLDNDLIFSEALWRTKSVMGLHLSKSEVSDKECNPLTSLDLNLSSFDIRRSEYFLCNTSSLKSSAKYNGFVNIYTDEDAILRRMPLVQKYKDINIPTLSVATLLSIDPELKVLNDNSFKILNHTIKTDTKSNVLLNFYDETWYKKVSIIDLLSNRVPANILTGKIVLIGSSAVSLHDQIIITGGKKIAGVKVHVTMLDNLLNDDFLRQPEYFKLVNVLVSLFFSLVILLLLLKKHKYIAFILFLTIFGLLTIVTAMTFKDNLYISIGYLLIPFVAHFFLISLFYIILDSYDRHLFKAEMNRLHIADLDKKIKERTADLVASHKHIADNIEYASLMQSAILPDASILKKYTQDSFVFWKPKDTVGGDIYFASELKSKEEVIIMVIDGAGHSVSGAFITMLVKAIETQILSEISHENLEASPALILEYFNRSIKNMLKQDKSSKSNAGFDGGVLYYNKKTNICTYAGAKTDLYVVDGEDIQVIKSDRKNVGYVRTKIDQKYTEHNVLIKSGTQLYISTDGYTDQEGVNNKRFSRESLQNLLENIKNESMDKQKKDIIDAFNMFKKDYEQSDDITVVGLKF